MKTNLSIVYVDGKKMLKTSEPGSTYVLDRDAILYNTSKLKQRLAERKDNDFNESLVIIAIHDLEQWLEYFDTHNWRMNFKVDKDYLSDLLPPPTKKYQLKVELENGAKGYMWVSEQTYQTLTNISHEKNTQISWAVEL